MKFAVLDFETTGASTQDEAIQIGLVLIENDQIIDRYHSFIHPGIKIPENITRLTGITNDMVKDAPSIRDVMRECSHLFEDAVFVAHQADFDLGFLQRSLNKSELAPFPGRVLDTIDLLRILFPGLTSLQLGMVAAAFDIPHERPHQADSDAEATALIWLRCLERLDELPLLTLQRLCTVMESAETVVHDMEWFLRQRRQQKELEISLDLDANRYFRQFALHVKDWSDEAPARLNDPFPDMSKDFSEFYMQFKQKLKHKFANYEERPAQEKMVQEVHDSFSESKHLLVEAGTGTGKSIGYLIPALHYGITHDEKVVVSTHTIQLQEQIRQRDIPLLQDIFPVAFRASVLKGRSHYLCLRKFEHKINLQDYEETKDDRITAAQMIVWLGETERGDDEELHFIGKGRDFWQTVQSDSDSCLNRSCPWFKKCFYHRARHEASIADVVVTNHALLFTDVVADNRLLPSYRHLVVDEAHHFEDAATKHFGSELRYYTFVNTLSVLYRDSRSGMIPALRNQLLYSGHPKSEDWEQTLDAITPKWIRVKEQWDELCDKLYSYVQAKGENGGAEVGQQVVRLKKSQLPADWEVVERIEDNIYVDLTDCLKKLEKMLNEFNEEEDNLDIQALVTDLAGGIKDLYAQRDVLRSFMRMPDDNLVYWMEASAAYRSKSLQINTVPIDVSSAIRQHFFDVKESIVMTSATLSVDKSFQYACEQFGIASPDFQLKLNTAMLPSPFNYRKQALVCIPRDFPMVKGIEDAYFLQRLVESLGDVAIQMNGGMLVLFTSYRMLKLTYDPLKEKLSSYGIQVLGQGMDSGNRSKLTRAFTNGGPSVLLGTSSFWEGIDIPGDALSCLSIVRLPFQPPNHPLVEAKCEAVKKENKNPFMAYSVPQAVIRFKQGFGRLVRTSNDRGIVVIYDTRVIDTKYGKHFLYSLPGPKIEHMPTKQLVPRIREWLEAGERKQGETV